MNILHVSSIIISPDSRQDLVESQYFAGITRQINQQAEFDTGELDPSAFYQDTMIFHINIQVSIIRSKS